MIIAIPLFQYNIPIIRPSFEYLIDHITKNHEIYFYNINDPKTITDTTDIVFIWNGSDTYKPYIELKKKVLSIGSRIIFCEHGWMPQKDTLQIDTNGINYNCSWRDFKIPEMDFAECESYGEEKILIPLQNETDTQIINHSKRFKKFKGLIDFVLNLDIEIVIRKHPRFEIPKDIDLNKVSIDKSKNFSESIKKYKYVFLINSTVGFECIEHNKDVYCFGDSLYNRNGLVNDCRDVDIKELKNMVNKNNLVCKNKQDWFVQFIKKRQFTQENIENIDKILFKDVV
jgi:hypothetical protein